MHTLDDDKSDVLDRAAALGSPTVSTTCVDAAAFPGFLSAYYRFVAPEDVVGTDPTDLVGAVKHHLETAERRLPGTVNVDVFTPEAADDGWAANGRTVVEIVVDDMPFLVDTAAMAVARHGLGLRLQVHPQFWVRRDADGRLLEVLGEGEDDRTDDAVRESWMHLEVERVVGGDQRRALRDEITDALRDVAVAVEDWPSMRSQALATAASLAEEHGDELPVPQEQIDNTRELLEWLAMDHFTFLGYREYRFEDEGDSGRLSSVPGTGLGLLRDDPQVPAQPVELPANILGKARERKLLIFTKANSRSTVHRSAYLDYVGIKTFDADGNPSGEKRFLGLLSSSAYTASVTDIPLLRRKAALLFAKTGFDPASHNGKALLDVLETFPRDELLQASVADLLPVVTSVLHLQERRQVRMFIRRDTYDRYLSCLLYLPRDRYTTAVRLAVVDILRSTLRADSVDYAVHLTDQLVARVQFVVRMPMGSTLPEFDADDLERRVVAATRDWTDDFGAAVGDQLDDTTAARLVADYGSAFPEAYKEDFPARVAVADAAVLDAMDPDDGLELSLYRPFGGGEHERRFKFFRTGAPVSLSDVLPILDNMGVEVTDERPYSMHLAHLGADRLAHIYDFGLRLPDEVKPDADARDAFEAAFRAAWVGEAESDEFNGLVLSAGLSWRQVVVLRAYQRYLQQVNSPFSQRYIEGTLLGHADVARRLVQLFETRFDPELGGADDERRTQRSQRLREEILTALEGVASLDEDRILRGYLRLIEATLRTNYFQPSAGGEVKPYLSMKFDPHRLPDLPQPRPAFEIFVYSPEVEGVHLRFGAVARGGLRWSDRREDFRTEVLGLVKAQMVKNTVIVPVGAKGGFFAKRLPDASVDRDAWMSAGIEAYKTFVRGMLDITDNISRDDLVPPEHVVRYDGDDPYLVVAADKGTATFSDIANSVAIDYGFWLGDAFASGGSVGYDHKAMGITARGAWESVKRHFRDMGTDCQAQDFTCVGVGDMSGDVFGNGMLLSEHTRLVAAFDHRHVFLDPDPDATTSYAERRRLFDLPRSSWADYDQSLISAGGGVFPRTLKSVPISPQVRTALGLGDDVTELSPPELMRAILLAPVDLFFNGGIGTYVKASTESAAQVGDKANDAVRVDGRELRCRCVGEGGNLGLTQLGRVEYALAGGRIDTDFIDNSAGVDTSDHEVNIKILLDQAMQAGDLTGKQRGSLLASMTDEVADLVLKSNYRQNVALANAEAQAPQLLHVHRDWIDRLERAGQLDRALEFLPDEDQIATRLAAEQGLTTPELAVLLAYTKIVLAKELIATSLPDDSYLSSKLVSYFPTQLTDGYGDAMHHHRLRRDIITNQVVNEFVNNSGITCFHRLSQETGGSAEDVVRANLAASRIFDQPALLNRNAEWDNVLPAEVQTRMRIAVRTLVERATRWLVMNTRPPLDIAEQITYFAEQVAELVEKLPELLRGRELALFEQRREQLLADGVEEAYASRIAALPPAYGALGIVSTAHRTGVGIEEIARVHYTLGEQLSLGVLLERIVALPRHDRWQTMARAALRDDLHAVHAQLTRQVLDSTPPHGDPEQRCLAWRDTEAVTVARAIETLEEINSDEQADLSRLSVGLRVVRGLLRDE